MKRLSLLLILILITIHCHAQIHLKSGAHISIVPGGIIAIEFGLSPQLGLELSSSNTFSFVTLRVPTINSGTSLIFGLKHYFGKKLPISGFYLGSFTQVSSRIKRYSSLPSEAKISSLVFGISTGIKILDKRKYFLEVNGGLGATLNKVTYETDVQGLFLPQLSTWNGMINILIGMKIKG